MSWPMRWTCLGLILSGLAAFADEVKVRVRAEEEEGQSERLFLPPRESETLTVMPRVFTGPTPSDPFWLSRGALRDDGTYESPRNDPGFEINERRLEFLRTLDRLRLFEEGEFPDFDPFIRPVRGPEILTVPPRVVK